MAPGLAIAIAGVMENVIVGCPEHWKRMSASLMFGMLGVGVPLLAVCRRGFPIFDSLEY